ncbi:MAG: TIGR03118 family protein, partial [Thermoanaerobaculia bacterium]
MIRNRTRRGGLSALGLIGLAAFAAGQNPEDVTQAAHDRGNDYRVTILVSNEQDEAPVVDPLLVNAWGIAASDTGPWWIADNGTGYSTVYDGDGAKRPLEVKVPGAPTGIVHNGGTQFQLAAGTPATFLFASEDGTFSGWNASVNPDAVVVFSAPGSNFKGLAIHGDVLYSTDFGQCRVEAFQGNFFDNTFAAFDTAGGFQDHTIPTGFCPFGIQTVGDDLFVTYAQKDGDDDVPGIGHGFVRQFDGDGNLVARVGSRGLLNSPWGLAMAPEDFGRFGGCLLVG